MKKTILIVVSVVLTTLLIADVFELQPNNTELEIVNGSNSLNIKLQMEKLDYSNISRQEKEFTNIFVEDWHRTLEVGRPALPKITKMIIVPEAGISVDIKRANYTDIELEHYPFPAQKLAVDSYDVPSPDFKFDEEFYNSKQVYPDQLYEISPVHEMRGVHFVYLSITPIQYIGQNNSLRVAQELELLINYNSSIDIESRLRSQYFDAIFAQKAINYEVLEPIQKTNKNKESGAELLIITSQEFTEAAENFKNWKQQQGFTTALSYVEDIGTDPMNIYFHIYEAYYNWEQPPSFLLILGDVEYIPTNYIYNELSGGNLGTDRLYSCMDGYNTGDYHPDIASGRMAIDADEADTVIEKIINYQKYPPQLNSFYDNATICSFFQDYDDYNSYEDRRFVLTCEETRDFLLENDYNAQRIYVTGNYVDPLYYNDGYYANGEPLPDELLRENGFAWDGGSSDITNAIQDGTFMVYHRDHGAPTGWGDPPFQIGNVNNLQNQNLLPFVFSMNCASGYFDMETDGEANNFESFSEQFLRNPNGGAVSLISACRNSLSGYNDYLALGMIDSIWEEFYPDFNYANSEGYMGTVLLAGFAAMEEFWYSEWSKYEMDIFHVMGDPTLQIWRQQPQSISASHNTLFTLADNIIPVSTNIEHGRASITHNGELLAVKEFDNSDFDIVMNSNLNQPAIVKLTITARDHEPYISDLSFIPENGGYVVLDSLTITDNNGNNDGQWDAGEVLELNFHLTNAGNQAISGSEVNLVSNNEFLSLSETFFQLGELQPQTAEQIEVEAELTMACSHAQLVEITILIANAENDYINSITFPVTKKPKLVTNLEPISIENLEEIEVIPFYLENIGSEELQVNLTNISNQAADISDPESYLKIPDSDDFHDLEEFSIMFWMKTIPNNNLGFAISKGVSLSNSSFIIAPLSTSSFNYYFWDANGERQFKLVNADLSYHKWNHICVTVSSTHIKIYFNGELVSEEPFISPIWNTNEDIFIGCDKNGNFQFDGHIDELAFYNIALNETEIAQKLQNSFHQEENGLISYYRLDTDFFIADLVGQNHAINVGEILFDVQGPNIITWMGAEEYDFTIEPFETIESNLIFNPFGYDFAEYSSEFLVTSNAVNTDDIIIPISWDNMLNNEPQDLPHPLCNMQIYPNPFNPETTISFTLAKTQKVSLNIYNIKGQKVRSLLPETDLEPGKHDYTWEGYDNSAQKVSSGIYFVVMKSDENGAITKKMLLLK